MLFTSELVLLLTGRTDEQKFRIRTELRQHTDFVANRKWGIMFPVGMIEDKLYGPFCVPEAVKLTSNAYTAFLDENLSQWLDGLSLLLRFKVVFMTIPYLMLLWRLHHSRTQSQSYVGKTLMTCPPSHGEIVT